MKLVHWGAVFVLATTSACAGTPRKTAATAPSAPVSVTAAEWKTDEQAPRVGKAQRSEATEEPTKELRRSDSRPGGGFSGWK